MRRLIPLEYSFSGLFRAFSRPTSRIRASTRRVLRAQQDLFEAENALTDALVDYAIANLEFYRDTGVLAVRHDGSWTVEPTDGAARLVP